MKKLELNHQISVFDFKNNYWYKKELQIFCRKYGLGMNGGKIELEDKIIYYLKTGKKQDIKIIKKRTKNRHKEQLEPQSLDEELPANFNHSQFYRIFFKKVIGNHFRYQADMMIFLRNNPDITFRQYIEEWQRLYELRKNPHYKTKIWKSCQYNQYIRDFFNDNPDKTFKQAIICWNYKKGQLGVKKYQPSDLVCLK